MSSNERQQARLGDLCHKIGSGVTPRGGANVYIDKGVALIRSQNIYDFSFDYDGLAFIDNNQAQKMRNVEVKANDVLLNITGDSVARCCMVPDGILPARVNQHVSIIRSNAELLDPKYLLYFVNNPPTKELLLTLSSTGATRKALTKEMIENLIVTIPSIDEQKTIAATLSCLDDKIELNNRINKNLEEMAQAIFKSWFVDFEPFQDGEFEDSELGRIPKGWRVGTLGEMLQITSGYAFRSSSYVSQGQYSIVTIKNVDDGKFLNIGMDCIAELPNNIKDSQLLKSGDIIMSLTGNVGRVCLVYGENYLLNQRVAKLSSPCGQGYVYALMRTENIRNTLVQMARGTAQPNLSINDMTRYKLIIPGHEILARFNDVIIPMINAIIELNVEIDLLIKIRDSLLPKLMSGEIRVPVEEVQ